MSKTKASKSVSRTFSKPTIDPIEAISKTVLQKYCSKRLFEIELIFPAREEYANLVERIAETGKEFENISSVFFISFKEVLNLRERVDDLNLPKDLKACAKEIITQNAEKEELSYEFLAQLTKLKIIETMYENYKNAVEEMQEKKAINEKLLDLLKDCDEETSRKKGKKGKKEKKSRSKSSKSKSSKKSSKKKKEPTKKLPEKKIEVITINDYTDFALEQNEVISDYNPDNQVIYIVLFGFEDVKLLPELFNLQIPISAVIDIAPDVVNLQYNGPISQMKALFDNPTDTEYLENTVWMKFRSKSEENKELLEELTFVVKQINYIKRHHLKFIKNLKIYDSSGGKPPEDFEKYTKILDSYAPELVNIPLILNALIEQICWSELSTPIYSLSDLTKSSKSTTVKKPHSSYQVHEEDELKKIMHTYGEIGSKCYEDTLKYLQLLGPVIAVAKNEAVESRNVGASTEESCYCTHLKELFDYLHFAIFTQMGHKEQEPPAKEQYYLTENLVTFDGRNEYFKVIPRGYCHRSIDSEDLLKHYHMKEDLSKAVWHQLVFKAMKEYNFWCKNYCEESGAILLVFHDNLLNNFGVNTTTWSQNLPTIVCLRDFARYTSVEEQSWLENNKLPEHTNFGHITYECEGIEKLNIPEIYKEYQFLLEPTIGTFTEDKIIYEEILDELATYPKKDLTKWCSEDGTIPVYDLGPKQCQLTGHTTTFRSDDGVKITIDTSRFLIDKAKCTIIVDSNCNSLVFHNHDRASFHFITDDGSLVNFREPKTVELPIVVVQNEQVEPEEEEEEPEEEKILLNPISSDYFVKYLRKSRLETLYSSSKTRLCEKNVEKLLKVVKSAIEANKPVYKFSTRVLSSRIKEPSGLDVPLVSIVKNVLFKPPKRKKVIRGYSFLKLYPQQIQDLRYDFDIMIPNGLFVTTTQTNSFPEIKQEYKYSHDSERYRTFYKNGMILVKLFNGSLLVYRANGDIITLKDDAELTESRCSFTSLQQETTLEPSRRLFSTHQIYTYTDLYELGNIPYTFTSILKFNGKKLNFKDGNTEETQPYFVVNENDYHAKEVFYEREDGMKCLVDKEGQRIYQFPDSTKITAFPKFEKEEIVVDHKMGNWVSVVVSYVYEHPKYLTVKYDQIQKMTTVQMKDFDVNVSSNSIEMIGKKNMVLTVSPETIKFRKICSLCEMDCTCIIQLGHSWKLLQVIDSYEKIFTSDELGNCEINQNYIKGDLNKNNCNHVSFSEKQKFFILNKERPFGSVLWRDRLIEEKISNFENVKYRKLLNYVNKLTKKHTLEFYEDIRENYVLRYTQNKNNTRQICLAKYKVKLKKRIFYATYRILSAFQDLVNAPGIVAELDELLETYSDEFKSVLVRGLKNLLLHIHEYVNLGESSSFKILVDDEVSSEESVIRVEDEKPTAEEIIKLWQDTCYEYKRLIRNQIFPGYFHSKYYHNVMSQIK